MKEERGGGVREAKAQYYLLSIQLARYVPIP
jgi:hypothetical protein